MAAIPPPPSAARSAAAPAGRSAPSRVASWLLNSAPNTATPIDPPTDRKKFTLAVATPMSRAGTADCTASTMTCMTIPSPAPKTTMKAETCSCELLASMVDSRNIPIAATPVPMIGNTRYLPVRPITCPEPMEVTSSPAMSGTSARPAPVADVPMTTSRMLPSAPWGP